MLLSNKLHYVSDYNDQMEFSKYKTLSDEWQNNLNNITWLKYVWNIKRVNRAIVGHFLRCMCILAVANEKKHAEYKCFPKWMEIAIVLSQVTSQKWKSYFDNTSITQKMKTLVETPTKIFEKFYYRGKWEDVFNPFRKFSQFKTALINWYHTIAAFVSHQLDFEECLLTILRQCDIQSMHFSSPSTCVTTLCNTYLRCYYFMYHKHSGTF